MSKTLHLHLKYEYFDAIREGTKDREYREASKWSRRLEGKEYTSIRLYRGYQKVSDDTVIDLNWLGFELQTITHKHFGVEPVEVCAIDVTGKQ